MTDPHFNHVTLLLPMAGDLGTSGFFDLSESIHQVSIIGNPTLSNSQTRDYAVSGGFNGNGGLIISSGEVLSYTTEDFTVETWLYIKDAINNCYIYCAGFNFLQLSGNAPWFWNDYADITSATPLALNSWHHVAVSRNAGTTRLFANGVVLGSTDEAKENDPAPIHIGHCYQNDPFDGYMQDFRVTVGVGRYTAAFTPPARLAGSIAGTVTEGSGAAAARTVVAVPRRADVVRTYQATSSAADGSYQIWAPNEECSVIALADESTLSNDAIARVIPG